jgi:ribonuclease D
MTEISREELISILSGDISVIEGSEGGMRATANLHSRQLIDTCLKMEDKIKELANGSNFSVMATLPGVSNASHSATTEITKSLVRLLRFSGIPDVDSSDIKDWSLVEDALDAIFSSVDECVAMGAGSLPRKSLDIPSLREGSVDLKPQSQWFDPRVNYRSSFIPIIREKLNASQPLDPLLIKLQSNQAEDVVSADFGNVYEIEIRQCLKMVSKEISETQTLKEIVECTDLESTPLVYIDSEERLDEMIEEVVRAKEVAMDLEHHDIHSYRGFTSLIQLSTRDKDFLIDPFTIFKSLHKLNIFTTDPKIKKVLHGADMDIQWLQRDFGVYIVNMFDTGQAARVLGLAGGFGLANLLDTFCKVKTNKRFQMADWRQRPLSKEMQNYARIDTHYLIYIRDRLENLILAMGGGHSGVTVYGKKMLIQVMEKSFGISSKVYRDPASDYDSDSVKQFCLKQPALKVGQVRTNPKAMATLRGVLKWRDETAKKLDESRHYVLSNSASLRLANSIPTSVPQILRSLSFESSNGFPSMNIDSAGAEEMLGFILTELASVEEIKQSTPSKMDVELEEKNETPATSRRNSVVSVSGFGKIERRESVVSGRLSGEHTFVERVSALSAILSVKHLPEISGKHEDVLRLIEKSLNGCPPLLQAELDARLAAAQIDQEMLREASIPVPQVETEFVSFTNAKKPKTVAEMMETGELPETVREERKRLGGTSLSGQGSAKKKAKKSNNSSTTSATAKALAFIEEELSLGKKH